MYYQYYEQPSTDQELTAAEKDQKNKEKEAKMKKLKENMRLKQRGFEESEFGYVFPGVDMSKLKI